MILRFLIILSLFLLPMPSMATEAQSRDDYATACQLTPPNRSNTYPGVANITQYNNLVQPEGKSIIAAGEFVYLSGRIFDERCVPLSEARVEMWQANGAGKYIYPDKGSFANPYPLFAGTGATVTDGEGRYSFFTIFPGTANAKSAPQIHFRITHPDTKDLFTTMFFSGDVRNTEDATFRRIPVDIKPLVVGITEAFTRDDGTTGLHVHHDITVKGSDKFRRF
ncbi:MAG: hypothetical protein K2Q12_00955 [Rickettsiales bacterium]|nr:hypothetical protein [Rickettsiales bacterium]